LDEQPAILLFQTKQQEECRHVQRIFGRIAERVKAPEFRDAYVQRPEGFSRHRKWDVPAVVGMILNRIDRTTAVEVQKFVKQHLPNVRRLTKPAFSQARDKLLALTRFIITSTNFRAIKYNTGQSQT